MEKAIKDKRIAGFVCACAFIFGIAFTALAVMRLQEARYVSMLLLAVFSAVCFYIFVFNLFKYQDAKTAIELIDIIECYGIGSGPMRISELSEAMGWQQRSTRRFIETCRKRGYFY
ncbi:MAG: hypothetical protein IKB23_01595 [Clostridia bacterium]|nr:hypothetical protein [Clostridia bacterium]